MKALSKRYWQREWFPALIIGILFTYLLHLTWLKWGDLIVDIGREMYVPGEISLGKLLYRDISYTYGPFSPYFNAALFKLFGTHLHSLIISGIITTLAAIFLVYRISRFFLNTFFSTFVVLTFLIVFAFGQYVYFGNYNFILPYSYPAIHGLVFVLAALYFFYFSIIRGSPRYKYFVSFFITLTILTRIEMGMALLLSVTVTAILSGIALKETISARVLFYKMFIYAIIPALLASAIYVLFLFSVREAILRTSFFDVLFTSMSTRYIFTRWLFGLADFSENLRVILKSLFGYMFLTLLFALGGLVLSRPLNFKTVFMKKIFLWLPGFLFIFTGVAFAQRYFAFDWQYRPLPLILLVVIAICVFKFLKSKNLKIRQDGLILLSLSILALILLVRMLFFVRAGHYGFYILIPGMILYHIFFLKIIPDFFKEGMRRSFFRLGFLFVFVVFITSYFNLSRFCYKNKTLKVATPRGTIYAFDNDRENKCKQLIEYLLENTDENKTLVVFPEGLTINFLTKRKNPLYYYAYMPLDIVRTEIVEKLIKDMELKKIDYVVINQRRTDEQGYPVFGKDYAQVIREYILNNYDLLKQFGPFPFTREEEYGIAIFKRRI